MPIGPTLSSFDQPVPDWVKILSMIKPISEERTKTLILNIDVRFNIQKPLERLFGKKLVRHTYGNEHYFEIIGEAKEKSILLETKKLLFYCSNKEKKTIREENHKLRRLYPIISKYSFPTTFFRDLEKKLENAPFEVGVVRYVDKSYLTEPHVSINYSRDPFETILLDTEQKDKWLENVEFNLKHDDQKIGKVKISRSGLLTYKSLDFQDVWRYFLSDIFETKEVIRKITRRVEGPISKIAPTKIVAVRFFAKSNVFKSEDAAVRFIEVMRKALPNWSYAITYTQGNFIQLILNDHKSGAIFELQIVAENELVVVPISGFSDSSLSTLIAFIQSTIGGSIQYG